MRCNRHRSVLLRLYLLTRPFPVSPRFQGWRPFGFPLGPRVPASAFFFLAIVPILIYERLPSAYFSFLSLPHLQRSNCTTFLVRPIAHFDVEEDVAPRLER